MRHFKLPLIVTGVSLLVALIVGIAIVTVIHRAKISDREKMARTEMLGGGMAFGALMVSFPFWIFAAAKVGKERRTAREAEQQAKADGESN